MTSGKYRTGQLTSVALVMAVAPASHAQDIVPVPAPVATPSPAPIRSPSIITLPGAERFSIAPAQTPTPVPVPQATRAPAAASTATPRSAPTPRAAAPRELEVRTVPVPAASPGTVPVTTETAQPMTVPAPAEVPFAAPSASPVAVPAETNAAGSPWLWALLGAGVTAVLGLAAWALLRRRRSDDESDDAEPFVAAPPPPLPPSPPAAPQREGAPQAAPRQALAEDPFDIAVDPTVLDVNDREVLLQIELTIGNLDAVPAENVRVSLAFSSARPDQDKMIAAFHAHPTEPGEAFDLAPGSGGRIAMQLLLPRDHVHVFTVRGRPMFVPLVMIDLRWRSGLSIRRFGADFMVGTAGQGEKVGPIWLDRAAPRARLAATRYVARQVAAA